MREYREYQLEAINNFRKNEWRGILEMATGTGKTITSLSAAKNYMQENEHIFLIILVPFTHLADQWEKDCRKFGFNQILKCYGLKNSWINSLKSKVRDFNIGISYSEIVITTYRSASFIEFGEIIENITHSTFLIGDECHYFGIKNLRHHKFDKIEARLGLSATPDRWWDESGTKFLRDYFGKTVFEYTINQAIENKFLTEYKYFPIVTDFTSDEADRYEALTKRLIYLMNSLEFCDEDIEKINRQRSMIISKAENKITMLYRIFSVKEKAEVSDTLIYCAPGEVNKVTSELSKMGYRVHRFDSNVSTSDRKAILKAFANKEIQILVAIKCLDEGVDVPSTREAYFLSSTSNPREFIQRRGRILRKFEGKTMALVYDFITLPSNVTNAIFVGIATKELPRFAEFANHAINKYEAREKVAVYLRPKSLEHLMDKLPWEVYKESQIMREGI